MPSSPPDAAAHLRATAARLDVFDVGTTAGEGWHPLTMALDPAWTVERVDRLVEGNGHGPRPRPVSGAYLGAGLAWVVAMPVAAALVTEHRALDAGVEGIAVHVDHEGWPTRMAVLEPRFATLAGDPAAGCAGVAVVPDPGGLVEFAADRLADTFTAVFASVRRASPYGTSGLWGSLADHVASVLWLLHQRGATNADLARAWRVAEDLVDAIQRRQPRLKARARLFHFDGPTAPVNLPMRGTCCLYYTTPESQAAGGDGLCGTCPRRPDEERVRLVGHRLRQQPTRS